jgi:predicted ATPase
MSAGGSATIQQSKNGMTIARSNYHVITGGPGSGKSLLVEALRDRGYRCVDETGRQIIRDQLAIGGNAHHGGDQETYAELMLSHGIRDYRAHMNYDGPVFFDRGIAELVGYFVLIGRHLPTHFIKAADLFRTGRLVFLAPVWPEIYRKDAERKQDLAEAIRTSEAVSMAYRDAGYRIAELPKASVEDRATFVLGHLGLA